MTLFSLLLLSLLFLLSVYVRRLRRQHHALRHELRRVLRAGAGQVETQERELRWQRTLATVGPIPVLVTDARKQLLFANPAAETHFGAIRVGEGAIERLRDHNLESVLDEALSHGEAGARVVEVNDQYWLASAQAWPGGNPNESGAVLILQDVTELQRLSRARRDMAANLSHELRTPLASVKLMSETLLTGGLDDPGLARRLVTRIATENDAMIRLVEDLTALTWIETGRTPLRLERLNLRELVEMRLQRLAPHQELKRLHFALDGSPCAIVALDPERFGQVLTNLLDNAIKFSPVGGTIHLTLAQDDEATTLTLRDEGPGIQPADLPRIFERFYKGDRARTRGSSAGTGLGLAIARHLVEAHGGTLTAANHPTRGALFTITLPHE